MAYFDNHICDDILPKRDGVVVGGYTFTTTVHGGAVAFVFGSASTNNYSQPLSLLKMWQVRSALSSPLRVHTRNLHDFALLLAPGLEG